MRLTNKRILLALSLTLSMVLTLAASGGALSADKHPGANPCAANPCAAMNPCSMKNPCAAIQASSDNVPIRRWPLKDYKKVVERGTLLWNDTRLGTSGVSCASCHPNGALLNAKPFPKHIKMTGDIVTLDQMINFCMINPMKAAKPLAWNSQKLTALAAYVTEQTLKKKNPCAANPCSMNPCATRNPCSMKNPCGN